MPPSAPAQLAATTARAYRELLKVQRALFRGDAPARAAALIETRNQFMRHANATPSETPDLIQDAYNTAGFLHENVAQTVLNDSGNYGACHPRFDLPTRHPLTGCVLTARCAVLKPQPQHMSECTVPPPLPCDTNVNL